MSLHLRPHDSALVALTTALTLVFPLVGSTSVAGVDAGEAWMLRLDTPPPDAATAATCPPVRIQAPTSAPAPNPRPLPSVTAPQ